ncbi:hypothetical protein [Moraxella bovoculi]|uniref:hypothetical protein n=1 Tax=Moraxella bovoculi TaxID=386891 RepID=UPI0012D4A694|nr:hypothetical protein [Moraxella bovoculi]
MERATINNTVGGSNKMNQTVFLVISALIFGTIFYVACTSIEKVFGFRNENFRAYMCLICIACIVASFYLYENGWHWFLLFSR